MKAVKLYKINWNLDNMDPEEAHREAGAYYKMMRDRFTKEAYLKEE